MHVEGTDELEGSKRCTVGDFSTVPGSPPRCHCRARHHPAGSRTQLVVRKAPRAIANCKDLQPKGSFNPPGPKGGGGGGGGGGGAPLPLPCCPPQPNHLGLAVGLVLPAQRA